MDATQKKNLGKAHSIEVRTRVKTVKSAKEALDRFRAIFGERSEAIRTINARKPMARLRAAGYEGSGTLMLEASSNLQRDGVANDAAYHKALMMVEQDMAKLQRSLLKLEAIVAEEYAGSTLEVGDDEEWEDEE